MLEDGGMGSSDDESVTARRNAMRAEVGAGSFVEYLRFVWAQLMLRWSRNGTRNFPPFFCLEMRSPFLNGRAGDPHRCHIRVMSSFHSDKKQKLFVGPSSHARLPINPAAMPTRQSNSSASPTTHLPYRYPFPPDRGEISRSHSRLCPTNPPMSPTSASPSRRAPDPLPTFRPQPRPPSPPQHPRSR